MPPGRGLQDLGSPDLDQPGYLQRNFEASEGVLRPLNLRWAPDEAGHPPQKRQQTQSQRIPAWSSKLFRKLSLAYVGVCFALAMAFAMVVSRSFRDALQVQTEDRLEELASVLAGQLGRGRLLSDRDALVGMTHDLASQSRVRVTIVAASGVVLADTRYDPGRLDNHRGRPEIVQAAITASGTGRDIRVDPLAIDAPELSGQDPDEGLVKTLYVACRVDPSQGRGPLQLVAADPKASGQAGLPLGYVRVSVPLQEVERQVAETNRWVWSLAWGGAGGVILLTFVLVRRLVRPLVGLTAGAELITRGDYTYRVSVSRGDELGTLARSFNRMSKELQRRTEQLRQDGERLATVLGSMVEGVIAVDGDECVLFANEAAGRLLEFDPHAVVGRPLWEAVRHPVVQRCVQEAFSQNRPVSTEFEITRTHKVVAMNAIRLPGHPSPGAVLVLHDVTDLRRLENLRRDFVANVSHELKTPLTAIQAYTETLLAGAIHDPEHNLQFLQRIEQQADRLYQLIMDVLRLAQIETRPETFEVSAVPLLEKVQECVEAQHGAALAKDISLTVEANTAELNVRAEADGLRTILDNLLTNALKYTPDNGKVIVRCQTEREMAVVEVIDTGIGIAPEQQARIFERFYRADRARSRDLGGTGLGLSIVKHLVQTFGGGVSVNSQLGQGSTFTIRLPIA